MIEMNEIEKLIAELCPDGVEFRELGALGSFYGGLSGKTKEDFQNGSAKYISYMNVYTNPSVNLDIVDYVHVAACEKQNKVQYGDVLFTGSSEVLNECGMSSVVTELLDTPLYLNSFCFGFRLHNLEEFNPDFLKHLFRSPNLRILISKTASGVTRFNVSKKKMERVKIPVPPLEVQEKIVKVLDKMTQLEAALEAELHLRRQQYEHYRNALLTFDSNGGGSCNPLWARILELCPDGVVYQKIKNVVKQVSKIKWAENKGVEFAYIDLSSVNRANGEIVETTLISSDNAPSRAQQIVMTRDILFGTTRPTLKRFAYINETYNMQICSTGYCVLRANPRFILSRFLFFYLQTQMFEQYVEQNQEGAGYPSISDSKVKNFSIPLPPLEIQEEIVSILDKFDALVNDLSQGLPAEIAARRQQYEYYRNRLLSFPEKTAKFS